MMTPLTPAQQALVLKNRSLIGAVIGRKRLVGGVRDWDDLYQVGCLGLMRAAQSHDPDLGLFRVFAIACIRNTVFWHIQKLGYVSGAASVRQKCFKINSLEHRMSHELGREPSPAELAERLGITEYQVQQELAFREGAVNIDDIDMVDASSEQTDGLPDFVSDMAEKFYDSLTKERERVIWREHVLSPSPTPLRDIGAQLGISGEMVRQIEKRLMRVFTIRVKATRWEEDQ